MVYAAPDDGSPVFETSTGKVPGHEEGQATGPLPQKRLTLLAVNERLMANVEDFRSEIILPRLVKKNALREGRKLQKSKMATFLGFLPFEKPRLPPPASAGARRGPPGGGHAEAHQQGYIGGIGRRNRRSAQEGAIIVWLSENRP